MMAETSPNIDTLDEGEIAADYLEELLDICDLGGDLEIEVSNQRTYVSINSEDSEDSEDLDRLSKSDVVQALQELTRLAVSQKTGEYSRLILDIAGSRSQRQAELEKLAGHAIEKIEQGAHSAALPPMTSYERKLVHDYVSDRGYRSESHGEGADRHTVISPVE
jgi:spoIIIJ-associated protein